MSAPARPAASPSGFSSDPDDPRRPLLGQITLTTRESRPVFAGNNVDRRTIGNIVDEMLDKATAENRRPDKVEFLFVDSPEYGK